MTRETARRLKEAEQYYAKLLDVSSDIKQMDTRFRAHRVPERVRHAALLTTVRLYRAGYRGRALRRELASRLAADFPDIDWNKWLPIIWEIVKFVVPLLVFLIF